MANIKSVTDLVPGERFVAEILNIQPNHVTIRLSSGKTMTVRSLVLPEARIGEIQVFQVKESVKGQILLEMVKMGKPDYNVNIAKQALYGASIQINEENTAVAKNLLDNGIPLDASILQKALFFNSSKEMDFAKMLFLLTEKFEPTDNNVEILNGIADGTLSLRDSLIGIISKISDINTLVAEDSDVDTGSPLFIELERINQAADEIGRSIYIELNGNDSFFMLNEYYNKMHRLLLDLRRVLNESAFFSESDAMDMIERTEENIRFMNSIKRSKIYLQIPFMYDIGGYQAELHVFRDPGKDISQNANLLVVVSTKNIGYTETMIEKNGNKINVRMTCDRRDSLKLFNDNSKKLSAMLAECGYMLTGFTAQLLVKPFNVYDELDNGKKQQSAPRRFSFDMRI